mgnify:CR=1 FL=1
MADETSARFSVRAMGFDPEPRFSHSPSATAFRADTDQSGEWYVWTRLSTSGWATMQRCENREIAQRLADDLNQRSFRVAV